MIMTGTRAQKKAAQRQEIIHTALRIVAEEGLDGLTVAKLARAVDLTPGALYRYYSGKDALIAVLNAEVLQSLKDGWEIDYENPLPSARRGLMVLVELAERSPGSFAMLALTLADPRVLVADPREAVHIPILMALVTEFSVLLDSAVERGQLTAGDAQARALTLIFGTIGALNARKMTRFSEAFHPRGLVITLIDGLLEGWRSPK